MKSTHSFSVAAAKEVGIKEAIILGEIGYWCDKNAANNKHFHDDRYWTYNSASAWVRMFPYLSLSAVKRCLRKLEDGGYIVTGSYNRIPSDKTKWYSITEKGLSTLNTVLQDGPEQLVQNGPAKTEQPVQNGPGRSKMDQEPVQNGPTLPSPNNISYPTPNPLSMGSGGDSDETQLSLFGGPPKPVKNQSSGIEAVIDGLYAFYYETTGRQSAGVNKTLRGHLKARLKDGYTPDQIKSAIRKKTLDVKGTKYDYMLDPDKLLKPRPFENALNLPETQADTKENDCGDAKASRFARFGQRSV